MKTQIAILKSDIIDYIELVDSDFITYEDIKIAIDQLKVEVVQRTTLRLVK